MAKWNAVGVQGALLSAFLEALYITSITVGRKFSEPHCARALCCRLQDFNPGRDARLAGLAQFATHHPCMLGTGVKLDESAMDASEGSGAVFSKHAFAWASGEDRAQCIDGSLGVPVEISQDGDISSYSSFAFRQRQSGLYAQWLLRGQVDSEREAAAATETYRTSSLREWKRYVAPDYEAAKDILVSGTGVFAGWRQGRV